MQKQLSEIDIYKYIFSRLVRISFSPEKVSNKELDILEEYRIEYPQIFQDAKNEAEDYLRSKVAGEFIPLDDNALESGGNGDSALSSKAIARLKSILQNSHREDIPPNNMTIAKLFNLSEEEIHLSFVVGDSMIEAGIKEGDIAVFRAINDIPPNGSIIIAALFGKVFIKRLKYDKDIFFLVSENRNYPPFKLDEKSDCQIIGQVIGKISKIQ